MEATPPNLIRRSRNSILHRLLEWLVTVAALVVITSLGYYSASDSAAGDAMGGGRLPLSRSHEWLRIAGWVAVVWLVFVALRFFWRKFQEGYQGAE
jgi:hypothetical protein